MTTERSNHAPIVVAMLATCFLVALAYLAGERNARAEAATAALNAQIEYKRLVEEDQRTAKGIVDGHRDVIAALGDRVRRGMVIKPPRAPGGVPAPVDPNPPAGADDAAAGVAAAAELAAARQRVVDLEADARAVSEACGKVAIDLIHLQQWAKAPKKE
jgi:hypothetical protein